LPDSHDDDQKRSSRRPLVDERSSVGLLWSGVARFPFDDDQQS